VHLLGYFLDPAPSLVALCDSITERAESALEEFLARLFARGIADIAEEDLRREALARCGEYDVWKKPLSADIIERLLKHQGVLPRDNPRALKNLFNEVCPGMRDTILPGRDEALKALRDSGATIMLAHPLGTTTSDTVLDPYSIALGLDTYVDGLEVFYPEYDRTARLQLRELARSRERPFCGGSDTHVFDRPEQIIFSDAPYECVVSMKEFRETGKCTMYPDIGSAA